MGRIVELMGTLAKPFMWLALFIGYLALGIALFSLISDLLVWFYLVELGLLGGGFWIGRRLNLLIDKTLKEHWRKRAGLLASDAECDLISITFKNWGFDFITTFEEYSKEGLINNWPRFWIGSEDDENKRITFDRVGDKWKPRTIPPLAEGGLKQ